MNNVNNNGLKPGALLRHDTYRIERILGQGGFGITYLATDLSLERYVAIKEFFPKDYCDREESTSHITVGTSSNIELVSRLKAKFLKEARNIAKFDHPGIIKIHTAFEENNTAYYVMDYIEGSNLNEIVKSSGALSESKAVNYMTQVGDALDYIHKHNVNHLDIKPANIMIRKSDDRPILIDFGLSKQYDSEGNQTSTTPTGISHGYAPMEQYKAGGVSEFSPQTDVYSLAATLYYLISGKIPPHATDLIEESISFPAGFPMNLRNAISKAMSSARKNRYERVSTFTRDITPIEENEETQVIQEDTIQEPIIKEPAQNISNKSHSLRNAIFICSIIAVIVIIIIFTNKTSSESATALGIEKNEQVIASHPTFVNNVNIQTTLGNAVYTGDVDESGLPHGKGVAIWEKGDGKKYDGDWVHGNMEGQTTYIQRSGDTFVGTFKDNRYQKGRYTIKEDGSYFDGAFKNGQPDQGSWYDKSGSKL